MNKKLWIIEDSFVMEPFLGGQFLGELGNDYELPRGVEIISLTQKVFDSLMEDYFKEHGHYPDQ